jgi:hypothetical protein
MLTCSASKLVRSAPIEGPLNPRPVRPNAHTHVESASMPDLVESARSTCVGGDSIEAAADDEITDLVNGTRSSHARVNYRSLVLRAPAGDTA